MKWNFIETFVFRDFSCYQMEDIKSIRYVGGFGKAVNIEVNDYLMALPDALFGKVDAEINYFNEFHSELLLDLFQTNFGIRLSKGKLLSIDSYGISVRIISFCLFIYSFIKLFIFRILFLFV